MRDARHQKKEPGTVDKGRKTICSGYHEEGGQQKLGCKVGKTKGRLGGRKKKLGVNSFVNT